MATFYLKSGSGSIGSGTYRGVWTASQTYAVGDRVGATRSATAARQGKIYECTTGGAAGGSEPTWDSTAGNTTVDNAATWTCRACSTWANAALFMDQIAGGMAAGDTLYVSQSHAETSAVALVITLPGTAAAPNYVICVNDGAEPPTVVTTTASVTTTGANAISISGHAYAYGITFKASSGATAASIYLSNLNGNTQVYEQCVFEIGGTSSAGQVLASNFLLRTSIVLRHCTVKFAHVGQTIRVIGSYFEWIGGSVTGTSIAFGIVNGPTNTQAPVLCVISGVDLQNLATTCPLVANQTNLGKFVFRNCRLPGSWTGGLSGSAAIDRAFVASLNNCDSADTQYRMEYRHGLESVVHETTLVRTGGATDGTTALSWKVVTSASCNSASGTFLLPEIVQWNETTGSAITATVEILHDSATALTDAEVWLEVMYLGTSGVPLGTWTSDRAADILATPANQTASTATWTTTGMSNPNTQALSVTITPREIGYIHARVVVAKASTTLYVDPVITVS